MHLKTFLLPAFAAACLLSMHSQAQMHLSDFSVYVGANTSGDMGSSEDFQLLAPNSKLLQNDFSSFNSYGGYEGINSNARISFMLGFDFNKSGDEPKSLTPQLRIGLTYTNGISLYNSYYKDERFPYDTLTSSRTGNQTYVDSVSYEGYDMNYQSDNIMLDLSLVFRTNPEARWSFYGGVGVMGGVSVNSTTTIYHYEDAYIEQSGNGNYYGGGYYNDEYSNQLETVRNENSFLISGYVPMGVDFRLGKRGELWKRTHLFFEIRPSLNINNIPELGTLTQGSVHHGFGIRIT